METLLTVREAHKQLGITDLRYEALLYLLQFIELGIYKPSPTIKFSKRQRIYLIDVQSLQNWLLQNSLN